MIHYLHNLNRPEFKSFFILSQPFLGLGNGERIDTKPIFVMHHSAETLTGAVINKCVEISKKNGLTHLYSIKIDDDRVFIRGCKWHGEEEPEELELEDDDDEIEETSTNNSGPEIKDSVAIPSKKKKSSVSVEEFRNRKKGWNWFGRK